MKQDTKSALALIQQKVKVSKNKFNKFGNFTFRSAEDILEALKPLLLEAGAFVLLTDDVVAMGDRIFLKSICSFGLIDGEDKMICSHGYAEIPDSLTGMSKPQITGSCSSYARKFAMNGLFLLDDSKEVDDQPVEKPDLNPSHKLWEKAKQSLKEKKTTIEKIRLAYKLSDENAKLISI
jgi:hypothetical protein